MGIGSWMEDREGVLCWCVGPVTGCVVNIYLRETRHGKISRKFIE